MKLFAGLLKFSIGFNLFAVALQLAGAILVEATWYGWLLVFANCLSAAWATHSLKAMQPKQAEPETRSFEQSPLEAHHWMRAYDLPLADHAKTIKVANWLKQGK